MKKYLLPATLALLLAACGGGGNDNNGSTAAAAPGPDQADAFTMLLQAQYSGQSETDDPQMNIDSVTLTTSETTNPVAI